MSDSACPVFPCEQLPENPAHARLLGVYPQRQEGLFMQRVKVSFGRITVGQWRAVAVVARRYCPTWPLHLTTRQDIELHGLAREDLPAVQRGMQAAGLTGLGACGDTARNVTACPRSGLCPGTLDLIPLAEAVRAAMEALPWIRTLPRKFKISLSGCGTACARAWINDIGFLAQSDGSFRVVVGGSLGARPGTGLLFDEAIAARDVVPFVIAALLLFNAEGDRANRAKARLRHVRERLGDAIFHDRLMELFREETAKPQVSAVALAPSAESLSLLQHLRPALGDFTAEAALALADAVEKAGAQMRLGIDHDLFIYGHESPDLPLELRRTAGEPAIIACPGTTWCSRGIADARATAQAIREGVADMRGLVVSLSGCPNNCSHAAVADIGLVGRIKTIGETRTECFRLLAGGGRGMAPALAVELHPAVPAASVPRALGWLIEEFARAARQEEPAFGEFVTRERERLVRALATMFPQG